MKNDLRLIILILLLLSSLICIAQNYPYSKIENNQNVWVLKEAQFNNALSDSKELLILKQQIYIYEQKVAKLSLYISEKDSIITLKDIDKQFYVNIWKKSEYDNKQLVELNRKCFIRKKIYRFSFFVSIPVFFTIGLMI